MGLFGNQNDGSNRRNPDAVFGFRALAAGYALYMLYQTVQMYISGEATSSIWLLIVSIVVLGGGAVYILISSFLNWKKEKAALKAAEQAENATEEDASEEE